MAWNARPAHRRGRIGSSSVASSGRLIIDVSVNPIGLPYRLYENWFEARRWLRHMRRKEPDKGEPFLPSACVVQGEGPPADGYRSAGSSAGTWGRSCLRVLMGPDLLPVPPLWESRHDRDHRGVVGGGNGMDVRERDSRAGQARDLVAAFATEGVRLVALTWVDNAGITRVKTVPLDRLEAAAAWGVGMSPVFDVFVLDDSITTSRFIGGPGGDLRLHPDLSMFRPLAALPGWAWAPADRYTQEGAVHVACQRSFARRMTETARDRGIELRMAFEIEWFVGGETEDGTVVPGCSGPAYGMTRVVELSDYIGDVVAALDGEDVDVEQVHPEYAPGQFELSIAAADPVRAADLSVLVRQTIRAVTQRHGLRASFAPVAVAGQVGNGA